jgi:hypothetical protein
LTTTIGYVSIDSEEFGGLLMVLALSYLDYLVAVLERVECILAALSFLKCELVENPRQEFRKQLETYPQLLQAVEETEENWDARNRFLNQPNNLIVCEALLWAHGWKTAHDGARQYWIKFLESLESIA